MCIPLPGIKPLSKCTYFFGGLQQDGEYILRQGKPLVTQFYVRTIEDGFRRPATAYMFILPSLSRRPGRGTALTVSKGAWHSAFSSDIHTPSERRLRMAFPEWPNWIL